MDEIQYTTSLRESLVRGIGRRQRQVRRRRLIIATMSLLVLSGLGIGIATGALNWRIWPTPDDVPPGVEPAALGPEKTITQGTYEGQQGSIPWRLTAFRSDQGLCVHFETHQSKGGGCGFGVPSEAAISYVGEGTTDARFVYGPVDRRAKSIELRFQNGDVLSVEPIGRSAGFPVNFYLFELDPDDGVVSVTALDEEGEELGQARL